MKDRVAALIADVLGLEPGQVGEGFSRDTADGWDSLNHLRIATAIEQEFGVTLTMDEIQEATSLERIDAIVGRHVSGK